jgi:hypothetical protein
VGVGRHAAVLPVISPRTSKRCFLGQATKELGPVILSSDVRRCCRLLLFWVGDWWRCWSSTSVLGGRARERGAHPPPAAQLRRRPASCCIPLSVPHLLLHSLGAGERAGDGGARPPPAAQPRRRPASFYIPLPVLHLLLHSLAAPAAGSSTRS